MNLSTVDINLLVALDALLTEVHVTRAARKIGLSQSAMSHTLARLRELTEDPLLVRAGRSMVLTTKAQALAPRVRQIMESIKLLFHPEDGFDPAGLRMTFRLRCSDMQDLLLLPRLDAILNREAPYVDLMSKPAVDDVVASLRAGEMDYGFGVFSNMPNDIRLQALYQDRFVCLIRQQHPALEAGRLMLDAYTKLPHVLVAPRGRGGGYVDQVLARYGLERRVARIVGHFLVAPHLVAGSDAVLTVSERLARLVAQQLDLCIVPPPLPLGGFTMSCIWHERNDIAPMHRWFRGALQRAADQLAPLPEMDGVSATVGLRQLPDGPE